MTVLTRRESRANSTAGSAGLTLLEVLVVLAVVVLVVWIASFLSRLPPREAIPLGVFLGMGLLGLVLIAVGGPIKVYDNWKRGLVQGILVVGGCFVILTSLCISSFIWIMLNWTD